MAKTKSSKQKKSDPQNQPLQNPTILEENASEMESKIEDPASNDGPAGTKDMVSRLKSLNEILVKETLEKRDEIKALNESKKLVETELTRSQSEIEALRNELIQMKDDQVAKDVISVFMESRTVELLQKEKEELEQTLEKVFKELDDVAKDRDVLHIAKFQNDSKMGEMVKTQRQLMDEVKNEKDRVNNVTRERDELEYKLSARIDELNLWKEKADELESKERSVVEQFEEMKLKCEVSEKALKEKEAEVESMANELSSMRIKCEGLRNEIEGINGEKEAITFAIGELCNEKEKRDVRICELENKVDELNAMVSSVHAYADRLQVKLDEWEKHNAVKITELRRLTTDLRDLKEEKDFKDKEISCLLAEKVRLDAKLNELQENFEEKEKLQNELNQLREKVPSLEESNSDVLKKNKKLSSEIENQKMELNSVTKERDEANRALEVEKMNGVELKAKVSELRERTKVIDSLKVEKGALDKEKREVKHKYNKLIKDKEVMEKDIAEKKKEIEGLSDSMKKKAEMHWVVMTMLKNTVMQISEEEDEVMKLNEEGMEELKAVIEEVKEVRRLLRERGEKVGEMEKEMEELKCNLNVKSKKNNFWAVVTSGTSVLVAAITLGYKFKGSVMGDGN